SEQESITPLKRESRDFVKLSAKVEISLFGKLSPAPRFCAHSFLYLMGNIGNWINQKDYQINYGKQKVEFHHTPPKIK
ncbi:MAG: hypothetical protein Q7T89_18345, partial [Anaerolineales bacterium]|nr:hypothetical protein [Anaerolineales bacterium]